ncbi:MAG: MATE family efflux transporter [Lachnospiraceae bacterium]|nr:MATE family efflux transporter [Lachnospiraceae bacterium]
MSYENEAALANAPIGPMMFKLAVPAVVAQLINMLYNIVDRIYIGHIEGVGRMALTGLGITFPIIMLISAFTAFVGMGGAPLASICLGQGNRQKAEKILGNSTTLLLLMSVALTALFSVIKRPTLMAFGASEATIGYAVDYISIYLIGTVFVQLALGLNAYITAQGHAMVAMCSVLIGAALNIILDPVFIFYLNMGVKGAALATVISQGVSACWVTFFLRSHWSGLRIRRKYMRLEGAVVGQIAALGIAPFIMQSTESLVTVTLNSGLQFYGGDLYVGTVTIMQSVMQMVVMPVQGITQGVQPILSYNFGAKNFGRVRKAFRLLLRTALTVTIASFLLVAFMPERLALIFNNDRELVALVGKVMPIFFGGIWAFGAQMACQATFMALGQAKTSLFLALLRKVILLAPLAVILPMVTGNVMGVYVAEPVADILASAITLTLFLSRRKKLLPENSL